MKLDRYDFFVSDSGLDYAFVSKGPKGNIIKLVNFHRSYVKGKNVFNLSFGDWNERRQKIDDRINSNNNDVKKVLATVASIVLHFLQEFSDATVYAKGSTPARTRLYRIGIIAHYQEITNVLDIYGYLNNEWQPFKKGINYEAFTVRRK